MSNKSAKSALIQEASLQDYFLNHLGEINDKSMHPLPREVLIYSSAVMDRMVESKNFFDTAEGKVRDKILGIKLMEAETRKSELRDIGDTALLLCGYFHESINNKIVDVSYYQNLGRIAYTRLNTVVPEAFSIKSFYQVLADAFGEVTQMIGIVSDRFGNDNLSEEFLIFVNGRDKISA